MTSEIRQRKAADDASEEKVDDGEQKNINIGELTTALRRAKNPRATYLGDRLQSYDQDGDGQIDAEDLGKMQGSLYIYLINLLYIHNFDAYLLLY